MVSASRQPVKAGLQASPIRVPAKRVLMFDMEARPIAWYGGDFVTKQITAVSSAYVDDPEGTLQTKYLTKRDLTFRRMLEHIRGRLVEADVVAGHYIRGFDLPLLNANLLLSNLPLLPTLLTVDTKGALPKMHGISKSMENLGAALRLERSKVQMNTTKWWDANTLTKDGIKAAIIRVEGDVLENIEMYKMLQRRGALAPPIEWNPGPGGVPEYTP